MAEIVGTVSAALTFIDFVFRVTKTAKTVRASDNGLDEYDRLRTFAESLKDGVKSLENDTRKLRPLTGPGDLDGSLAEAADRTVQVSKACLSVADEIITLIDKVTGSIEEPDAGGTSTPSASGKFVNKMKGLLGSSNAKRIHRAKSPTPNSNDIPIDGLAKKVRKKLGTSWQGTKVALAVMWNERELEGLRKEFQSCTEMLAFHWNTVFSLKIINMLDKQSKALEDAPENVKWRASGLANLSRVLKNMQEKSEIWERDIAERMAKLQRVFDAGSFSLLELKRLRILNSIRFEGMKDRQDDIVEANPDTLDWILKKTRQDFPEHEHLAVSFADWLKSGQGVFNITGKPGSGKSTLMKHLVATRFCETQSLLQKNPQAEGKRLLITRSFLWMLGQSRHQRSYIGLVRSLLHELLTKAPDLIPGVFPEHWARGLDLPYPQQTLDIPAEEFEKAMARALTLGFAKYHMCIFIDAADELEDQKVDFSRLATKICGWAKTGAQICVFSREESAFMNIFPASQRLRLHLVNEEDIRRVITDELNDHQHFLKETENDRNDFINEISQEANGVFLWATLVVKEMRCQLDSQQGIPKLRRLLGCLPSKLEDFYEQILKDRILPSSDKKESCMIMQIVATMRGWGMGLSYAQPEFGIWFFARLHGILNSGIGSTELDSEEEIRERTADFRNRSYGLFRGLVEIGPEKEFKRWDTETETYKTMVQHHLFSPPLRFIHRSALDFLRMGTIKTTLLQVASEPDMITALLKCLLVCTKNLKLLSGWHDEDSIGMHSVLLGMTSWLDSRERCEQYHGILEDLDNAILHYELGTPDGSIDWSRYARATAVRNRPTLLIPSVFTYTSLLGLGLLAPRLGASDNWTGQSELQSTLLAWAIIVLGPLHRKTDYDPVRLSEDSRGMSLMLSKGFNPNHQTISYRRSPWLAYIAYITRDGHIFVPGHKVTWYFVEELLRCGAEPRVWLQWKVDEECDDIEHEDMVTYLRSVKMKSFIQIGQHRREMKDKILKSHHCNSVSLKGIDTKFLDQFPRGASLRDLAEYFGRHDIAELIDGKIGALKEAHTEKEQEGNEECMNWEVDSSSDSEVDFDRNYSHEHEI